jgi:hypothetical protein
MSLLMASIHLFFAKPGRVAFRELRKPVEVIEFWNAFMRFSKRQPLRTAYGESLLLFRGFHQQCDCLCGDPFPAADKSQPLSRRSLD